MGCVIEEREYKVGQTFRMHIGRHSYKCHVAAVVDEVMAVYKFYGKHKQRWHYDLKDS